MCQRNVVYAHLANVFFVSRTGLSQLIGDLRFQLLARLGIAFASRVRKKCLESKKVQNWTGILTSIQW